MQWCRRSRKHWIIVGWVSSLNIELQSTGRPYVVERYTSPYPNKQHDQVVQQHEDLFISEFL